MIHQETGPDWVGTALNPVGPTEVRDDVLYVCEECEDFAVPADGIGAAVMTQHLESEHGFTGVLLEFLPCPECGKLIGCKLQSPPAGCWEHQ